MGAGDEMEGGGGGFVVSIARDSLVEVERRGYIGWLYIA